MLLIPPHHVHKEDFSLSPGSYRARIRPGLRY